MIIFRVLLRQEVRNFKGISCYAVILIYSVLVFAMNT
jgi:hypothetical protein